MYAWHTIYPLIHYSVWNALLITLRWCCLWTIVFDEESKQSVRLQYILISMAYTREKICLLYEVCSTQARRGEELMIHLVAISRFSQVYCRPGHCNFFWRLYITKRTKSHFDAAPALKWKLLTLNEYSPHIIQKIKSALVVNRITAYYYHYY